MNDKSPQHDNNPWQYERQGAVGFVTICNPPVNAISFAAWAQLPAVLERVRADEHVQVVILDAGESRHFCAGNDFKQFGVVDRAGADAGTAAVRDGLRAVADLDVPSLAAVDGVALGSGFMLASVCDIRLATVDAQFGIPEVKVSAFGGYAIARRVLPQGEARALALRGEPLSAQRAYELGYVHALYPDREDLRAAAVAIAGEWVQHNNPAFGRVAPVLDAIDEVDLWQGYELERAIGIEAMLAKAQRSEV